VNRVRDQFFAGACFTLDDDGGIGGRNPFDLLKYRFKRRAVTMICSNLRS